MVREEEAELAASHFFRGGANVLKANDLGGGQCVGEELHDFGKSGEATAKASWLAKAKRVDVEGDDRWWGNNRGSGI